MGIKHVKVSAIADAADTAKVRPSDWNTDHTIDGDVDFNGNDIINCGNFGASAGLFTSLGDVPNSYAGAGGKVVAVNSGASGLEFVTGGASAANDLGWVTPQQFGAVADGASHPLSEFYGTLAEAQAAYDGAFFFATALTQQIDYCACKAASNLAFGPDTVAPAGDGILGGGNEGDYLPVGASTTSGLDGGFSFYIDDAAPDLVPNALVGSSTTAFVSYGSAPGFIASSPVVSNTTRKVTCATSVALSPGGSMYAFGRGEHGNVILNRPIFLGHGEYKFGSDTWLIRNLVSGIIEGAGRLATTIRGDQTILAFDGIWYSSLRNFSLERNGVGTANTPALDIDGNVPGHPYGTRGVQGVHFESLLVDGGGGDYAASMCRQGGSSGQGSECSFLNCHFSGAVFACYFQNGFNALANTFVGGNFQNYTKWGIYVQGGTAAIINTGFQSTHGAQQIINGAQDIFFGNFGAYEGVLVHGCRTESAAFFYNQGTVRASVIACVQQPALLNWSALTNFGPSNANDARWGILANETFFQAITDGTTGAVEPDWTTAQPIVDGTVQWQEIPFYFVRNNAGSIDYLSVAGSYGTTSGSPQYGGVETFTTAGGHSTGSVATDVMLIDATAGAITAEIERQAGGRIMLIRRDSSGNTITGHSDIGSPEAGNTNLVMPNGQYGYRQYILGTDAISAQRMLLINTRYLEDMIASTPTAIGGLTVTNYITVMDGSGGTVKLAVVS